MRYDPLWPPILNSFCLYLITSCNASEINKSMSIYNEKKNIWKNYICIELYWRSCLSVSKR